MKVKSIATVLLALVMFSCKKHKNSSQLQNEIKLLNLEQGEIALCGSGGDQFGTVSFSQSCSAKVKEDFNLATALLHSFEYGEAEKIYAKVIATDPTCVMGYWGAAMCTFHPLWERPSEKDLKKGKKIVDLGRSVRSDKSSRESDYLEAVAMIYDGWDSLDHQTRMLKFEDASKKIYQKYPEDIEAKVFYALALRATADPKDKTFAKQQKAGDILNALFITHPNHPGIAHYIIHNYDYPELADQALPAARKYASIAAASAHALHMPSHIFTRLGLWNESVNSNISSISAAQCYAEKVKMKGHWDEELHGLDYLMYAYLQLGKDSIAKQRLDYLYSMNAIFPEDGKDAFSIAAIPARYVAELHDWNTAAALKLNPIISNWDHYRWESANVTFAKILGNVHIKNLTVAKSELKILENCHNALVQSKEKFKANFVAIQIKSAEAWITFSEGNKAAGIALMHEAANMEDQSEKHPVSPGEILPARELLGDMYMEANDPSKALLAYQADLMRHPLRFNGLSGAAKAAEQSNEPIQAKQYYLQLKALTGSSNCKRPEIVAMNSFLSAAL